MTLADDYEAAKKHLERLLADGRNLRDANRMDELRGSIAAIQSAFRQLTEIAVAKADAGESQEPEARAAASRLLVEFTDLMDAVSAAW